MALPDRPTSDKQTDLGTEPTPAFETPMYRIGREGLNLLKAIDDLSAGELARMSNVRSIAGEPLTVRPGQTALATTTDSDRINALFRLNDPHDSTFARLAGSSTNLYRGTSGAFTLIDSNYSSDPLTFAAASSPLSGSPFVFIGDRARNRKVDRTNAVKPIGLPPGGIISVTLSGQSRKDIVLFEASDTSAAASWTATAGQDRAVAPNASGVPVITDIVLPSGGNAIQVDTVLGAVTGAYDSIISIARMRNLNFLDVSNTIAASDDDQIHILFNVSNPQWLEEIKVYFVVSTFTAGAIPGNSANNVQAFFKAFRADDFTQFHERKVSSTTASGTYRDNTLLENFKGQQADSNPVLVTSPQVAASLDPARLQQDSIAAGRNVWFESGIRGVSLRRGDFAKVGMDQNAVLSWGTVTGIVIVIQQNTNQLASIQFDSWYIYGGFNPDTTDPEARGYDYRVRSRNIITGAKGNPSPVSTTLYAPIRQQVVVVGNAAFAPVDPNVRQDLFRRGGSATTSDDWYYVATSGSDGGSITDNTSDDTALASEVLETDNDQPVTSTDPNGNAVKNQVVAVFFRVEDYMFACGDPNLPGRLYRSKQSYMEAWPAINYKDVCGGSEELMNGGQYASVGFVFSRSRLYTIVIDADGSFDAEPTACTEGLVGRWAMAVTPFGIAFVSPFGVRLTTGGPPDHLSDAQLLPLFRGDTVRGMSPIDFTVPTALKLAYYADELWLTYADTGGVRRHLIYNFFSKNWRAYSFTTPVATVYGEPVQGAAQSILLGSNAAGAIYTHDGFSDLGSGIAYSFRTGCTDFGDPRIEKVLGEIVLDAEISTSALSVQAFLNDELTTDTAQIVVGVAGLRRYTFEAFGTTPQRARNVNVEVTGTAPTATPRPYFNLLGVSRQLQPAVTTNLPTPWEELPGGEGYSWGCFLTCDTGGTARSIVVEGTLDNGAVTTLATLTVTASGRKKLPFTWTSTLCQQIRLRPTGTCVPWIRFKVEWLADPEPGRLAGWDSNWTSFGTLADKWLKGVLIEADTFNVAKTVVLDADQSLAAVSLGNLTFNGRGVQQLSFAKVRGRLWRLRATDANEGKLFKWQPIFDEEPLALTRWESQERPHQGLDGKWQKPLEAFISLRSSGTVTLTVTTYGANGTTMDTSNYTIATTGGAKQKVRVPFNPAKGLLFVYVLTASAAFWLYREESEVLVEDWATGRGAWVPLLPSNDDRDTPRVMGDSISAAQTPGGVG